MRKNKLLMYGILLFSLMLSVGVMAQSNLNIPVASGEAVISDLETFDVSPHQSLGIFISQIQNTFKRFISYEGSDIFKSENIGNVEFSLIAFPHGTDVGEVTMGDPFESTEEVSVRGTTPHIWDSYEVTTISGLELSLLNEPMVYSDGTAVTVTAYDFSVDENGIEFELDGTAYSESGALRCQFELVPGTCPPKEDVEAYFGLNAEFHDGYVAERFRYKIPDVDDSVVVFLVCDEPDFETACDIPTNWKYFIERDGDYSSWEFEAPLTGYSVQSFEFQSTLILPGDASYDLFGQVA